MFLIGYFSHIALDMWSKNGIPLLWPLYQYVFVIPARRAWRLEVGTRGEMIALVIFLGASLALYHFEGMGFYRALHLLAKSIGFAKDDFIEYSSTNFTTLKGRFRDNATLEVKIAEYTIVAVYKEGLIVRDNSHLKSVSKLDSANLYPLSAVVEVEEPMRAISSRITLDGESIGELIQHVDPEIEHYILGEAIPAFKPPRIPEESDAYSPLYMSGDRIKFNYATIDDLKPFSSQVLKLGDVIVQYRLRPYEDPPSLNETPIVGVVETPLMFSVRDLDSIKVKVGDETAIKRDTLTTSLHGQILWRDNEAGWGPMMSETIRIRL
ncbi:MAG: rane-bound metal-dependent hydrolase, partial [Candidatus Dadabacteria bacterium]|nr:rane-bound metal-dependent hydrolase [Candidatus Dadabacteria bacterium]